MCGLYWLIFWWLNLFTVYKITKFCNFRSILFSNLLVQSDFLFFFFFFFFALYNSSDNSIEKLPISQVESFLKSNFWPKSNIQNSSYTKPLNLELQRNFIILLKIGETLWSYRKCQKIGVGRRLGQVRTKYLLAQTISEKNIWNKMEKLSETGKAEKSLISVFPCFLSAIAEV